MPFQHRSAAPQHQRRRRLREPGARGALRRHHRRGLDPRVVRPILLAYTYATCIYIICDNARYYRSKAVQAYLQESRIKLVFLPAYAPNLNLIERLWKFLQEASALQSLLQDTFGEFQRPAEALFNNPQRYRSSAALIVRRKTRHYRLIRSPKNWLILGINWSKK